MGNGREKIESQTESDNGDLVHKGVKATKKVIEKKTKEKVHNEWTRLCAEYKITEWQKN